MQVFRAIDRFFFRRDSATGFGLMRIAWAGTVLGSMLAQSDHITQYYSEIGMLPRAMLPLALRSDFFVSLMPWISHPEAVLALYVALLLSCLLTMIGAWPRLTTLASVVLLFSFHERNPFVLTGGDTVLRAIGFILLIAPGIEAVSLVRLRAQWRHWKSKHTLLPPVTMPAWPRILLLWQLIVIYAMSGWDKLHGELWRSGSAVAVALHHPHFSRLPWSIANWFVPASPVISWAVIAFELAWLLVLIPQPIAARLPWRTAGTLKRLLLLGGVVMHLGILLLMQVGSFPTAMFTLYLGLLTADDFSAVRRRWNKPRGQDEKATLRHSVVVLHDGQCGLCRRTMFVFLLLDTFDRLVPIDFHNRRLRRKVAPDLRLQDLNRALHIKDRTGRTQRGFDAFRFLAGQLPLLFPAVPFLSLPGVARIGRHVYARIAANRERCKHIDCKI